jgi:acetyl/propionyl-CoA carboxylase alpha subunit
MEKYPEIRHVEIQMLSVRPTVLHLGERDRASIQRRNQSLKKARRLD